MSIRTKTVKASAAALCALAIVGVSVVSSGVAASAATTGTAYDINVGVGSNAAELRFSWMSNSSATGELQIAKTSDLQNGSFPANSTKQATISKATATEGVEDTPNNTDQPISAAKDANGAALKDEYADKVTVSVAAGTSYSYRVGDGTNWSKTYTVQTADPSKGFTFAAFGDPQIGAGGNVANDQAGWENTLKTVYAKFPTVNFLYTMGDEVNDYDHVYAQQNEYSAFFNPSTSVDYLQTHILAAFSGNHDFQMGKYYSFHYNQPNLSTLGQTKTHNVNDNNGDYWFRYGNTLFMSLDGNDTYDVSAHDAFLKQAIAANTDAQWKVVSFHQAPYSEANHDGSTAADDDIMFIRNNWTKLMDKYDVDIVLNGHDHYYTRSYQMYGGAPVSAIDTNAVTNPKGTVYFTLDSGSGSKYYSYNASQDHSFSAVGWQNKVPTYTYAQVTGSTFTLTTYSTDSDAPIDTYTITKTTAPSAPATTSTVKVSAGTTSNPKTGDTDNSTYEIIFFAAASLVIATVCVVALKRKKADHE